MMSAKMFVMSALVAVACAAPRPDNTPSYGPPPPPPYKEPGMPYEFSYAVKDDYTGNDFGHNEQSDGQETSGSYRVVLPDGRTQTVNFNADHTNGYVAEVAYEGVASYPAPAPPAYGPHPPAPAPTSYGPPPPAPAAPAYGPPPPAPAPPAYGPPPPAPAPPAYGPPPPTPYS